MSAALATLAEVENSMIQVVLVFFSVWGSVAVVAWDHYDGAVSFAHGLHLYRVEHILRRRATVAFFLWLVLFLHLYIVGTYALLSTKKPPPGIWRQVLMSE